MKVRTGLVVAAAALSIAMLCVPRHKVHADNGCSVGSLKGAYSFSSSGFFADGNLIVVSNIGRIIADGAGGFVGTETVGNNGTIFRSVAFSGTYTVAPDCTETISAAANKVTAAANIDFVLLANGANFQYMEVDPGFSLTGIGFQAGSAPSN